MDGCDTRAWVIRHTSFRRISGRQHDSGKAPPQFPVEVWLRILPHVDTATLSRLTAVNSAFKWWCNETILCDRDPCADLPGTNVDTILLFALRRSLSAPPRRNVTCRFGGVFEIEDLCRLHHLVIQSSKLQKLHVGFRHAMFKDTAFQAALNDLIHAMSLKTEQRVVSVELPLGSIRCIQVTAQADPGLRGAYQAGPQQSNQCFKQISVMKLSTDVAVFSVTVKCLDSSNSGSLTPFTVVTYNTGQRSTIKLGDSGQSGRTTLTGHQLSAILPHITLDRLNTLEIHTAEIDPSVLREFLSRHRALTRISYIPVTDAGQVTHSVTTPQLFRPRLQFTRAAMFAFLDEIEVDANLPVDGGPNIVLEGIDKADLMKLLSNRVIYQSGT
ncbi:hypothetical protein C8R43DRAFT_953927 [Mycena crocata]|nr:hypothetical protein C8R43DRAFT_953927 [Mycena crocata]